ncbi:MAG: hypothetical protein RIQ33_201, partial [Bacteroidota bacterium]
MQLNLNRKRIFDYATTFGVEFFVMIISVLLFKVIRLRFEEMGFSEYTVSKRFVGIIQPLLILGFGISLPKYLAIETDVIRKKQLHYTVQFFFVVVFLIAFIICFILKSQISKLVYGSNAEFKLMLAIVFYYLSLAIHTSVYNFFRGNGNYNLSALMQLINLGLLPIIICFITTSVSNYFIYLTIASLIFSSLVQFWVIGFEKMNITYSIKILKEMLNYGYKRMPGDVIFGLFTTIPVFIASNYISLIEAGKIAFCMSLLNIVIAVLSPINIILLPESAKIIQKKDFVLLKSISNKMVLMSLLVGLVSLLFILIGGKFILIFFGVDDVLNSTIYLNIIFISVFGYSIYSVLRSIIDAYYSNAKNGNNVLLAFGIFLGIFAIIYYFNFHSMVVLLSSFSFAMNVLGFITFFEVK